MTANKSAIKMQSDFEDILNKIGAYADGAYDSVDSLLEDISSICVDNVHGYDEETDRWGYEVNSL